MEQVKHKLLKREPDSNLDWDYTLKNVRGNFGTLVAESANVVFHKNYRGRGDRYLLNTTAKGVRGPQERAAIDVALTPEQARKVYRQLKDYFEQPDNDSSE